VPIHRDEIYANEVGEAGVRSAAISEGGLWKCNAANVDA
jgi:hypothetical protein